MTARRVQVSYVSASVPLVGAGITYKTLTATITTNSSALTPRVVPNSIVGSLTLAASLALLNARNLIATLTLTPSAIKDHVRSLVTSISGYGHIFAGFTGQQWTPQQLNVLAWFQADEGITLDGSSRITRIQDLSTNAMSVAASSTSYLYDDTSPANAVLPGYAVYFDNAYAVPQVPINSKLPSGTSPVTLVMMSKPVSANYDVWIGYGDPTDTAGFVGIGFGVNAANGSRIEPGMRYDDTAGNYDYSGIEWPGANQTTIHIAEIESGDTDQWVNGVAGTNSSRVLNIDTTGHYLTLGGGGGHTGGGGTFGVGMIIDGKLTTDERQRLEGWLAWKAGDVSALPGGHPYVGTGRSFMPISLSASSTLAAVLGLGSIVAQAVTATALTVTASLSTLRTKLQSVVGSSTLTASATKSIGRTMTATLTAAASYSRQIAMSVDAVVTAAANLSYGSLKILAATISATATMGRLRTIAQAVTGAITVTATRTAIVGKRIVASITSAATYSRVISLIEQATLTTAASQIRGFSKIITAAVSTAASILALKAVLMTVAAALAITGTIVSLRTLLSSVTASITATASQSRVIAKQVLASMSTSASALKTLSRTLAATITTAASHGVAQFRTLTATALSTTASIVVALPSTARTFGKVIIRAAVYGISKLK